MSGRGDVALAQGIPDINGELLVVSFYLLCHFKVASFLILLF
jgi:hypothetical protein